jgi:hypothetical protein
VLGDDRRETPVDHSKCLVPRHLDVSLAATDHREPQAVGVLVQLLQRRALRADVPVREDVVAVAADPLHDTVANGDLETAGRLAQWTRPEVRLVHAHRSSQVRRLRKQSFLNC